MGQTLQIKKMALQELKVIDEEPIEVKRFYIPIELKTTCPNCSKGEIDFNNDYFSYPTLNKYEETCAYCTECESEFNLDVKIKMSLEFDFDKIRKI